MTLENFLKAMGIIFLVYVVGLLFIGPKKGLQYPEVETKALDYLSKKHLIEPGESIRAYKALNNISYEDAVVFSNYRVYLLEEGKIIQEINFKNVKDVIVKDTEMGHQQMILTSASNGLIGFEVYHTSVNDIINIIGIDPKYVHYPKKQEHAELEL